MRPFFYKGTAFEITAARTPTCFVELDKQFASQVGTTREKWDHRGIQLAEVLCGRLADVAYFGEAIPKALRRRNAFNAGHEARTLMVAHFGACKAVLDAGAIALAEIYHLGHARRDGVLKDGHVDFRQKGPFRHTLKTEQNSVYTRYQRFFSMINEIVLWRNAVVHRVPPLLMISSSGHPAQAPRSEVDFLLVLKREATIPTDSLRRSDHSTPLHFHQRWYDELVAFCGEVCQDINTYYSSP